MRLFLSRGAGTPPASRAAGSARLLLGSVLGLVVLITAGCGEATPTVAPPPPASAATATTAAPAAASPTAAAPTTAPTTAATAAATTAPTTAATGPTFTNPVLTRDFPDPFVLKAGDLYYAYATNGAGKNIQRATSPDLVHWSVQGDAMPALASWAQIGGNF